MRRTCSRRFAEARGRRSTRRRPRGRRCPPRPTGGRRAGRGCDPVPCRSTRSLRVCWAAVRPAVAGRWPDLCRVAAEDLDRWVAECGRRSPAISPRPPRPRWPSSALLGGRLLLRCGSFRGRLLRLGSRLGLRGLLGLLGGQFLGRLDHQAGHLVSAHPGGRADDPALGQHQEGRMRVGPHARARSHSGQLGGRGMAIQPVLQVRLDVGQLEWPAGSANEPGTPGSAAWC